MSSKEGPLNQAEKQPQIKFFFGTHIEFRDAEKLKTFVESVDIFCPELIGFDHLDSTKSFQKVSDGLITPEDQMRVDGDRWGGFIHGVLDAIHNTKKKIVFLDLGTETKIR